MQDQQTTAHAISTLTKLAPTAKTGEQPFFVTLGFHKPHLPWIFPKSFLDYYPEEDITRQSLCPKRYARYRLVEL